MSNSSSVTIKFKEGRVKNYFDAFLSTFGGQVNDNEYLKETTGTFIKLLAFNIYPDFEILLTNSMHNKTVIIDRAPDDDPDYFHIYIIKEGQFNQTYDDQKQLMEAGSTKGAFLYNGLFHIATTFPANLTLKSISFKLSRNALHKLIPEASPIFDKLFNSDKPIAYHTGLSPELELLVEDVFQFKKSEFGSKALIISRCFELLTLYIRSIKEQIDKDKLYGLHIDDYERLHEIKTKLLSSFNQKINIDEIANEFHISISKLKRDFKTLFDTSIYKFYTHAKMDEAYRRLKTGKHTVADVGYDLGYQNLSKFSEMFKKVKGTNPKDVIAL